MAAACGPACRLSTSPAPRCPLHCPPTPAMVITGLSSRVAVLGPPQSLNQAQISHLILPPPYRPPHRPPLPHCPPTRPWPSISFPGWKSVGRQPSRKTVPPATTLAMVITPVSVSLSILSLIHPLKHHGLTELLFLLYQSLSLSLFSSLFFSSAPSVFLLFLYAFILLPYLCLCSCYLSSLSHLNVPLSSPLLSPSSFKLQIPGGFKGFVTITTK